MVKLYPYIIHYFFDFASTCIHLLICAEICTYIFIDKTDTSLFGGGGTH